MANYYYVTLLLFFNFIKLISSDDTTQLYKCCPLDFDLSIDRNTSKFECKPSSPKSIFTTVELGLLVTDFPKCTEYQIIDFSKEKISNTNCIEKDFETGNLIGIKCNDGGSKIFKTSPVISVRKCCPQFRSYDPEKQYCWNDYVEDRETTYQDLIKLTVKNRKTFIDMSFGLPQCKPYEALTDVVVPYNEVEILNTDAILIKSKKDISLGYDNFCADLVDDRFEYIVVRYCEDYKVTCQRDSKVCVRKCCPPGQMMNGSKYCTDTKIPLSIPFYKVSPNGVDTTLVSGIIPSYLNGSTCTNNRFFLDPKSKPDEKYVFTSTGQVYLPVTKDIYDINNYCVENIYRPEYDLNGSYVLVCFQNAEDQDNYMAIKHFFVLVGSILSSIFLLLTFSVYACLPSLQNLHGKTVMCNVFTLFLGYVALTLQHVPLLFEHAAFCISLGYIMLFAFLSAFCWMNVICYDIWSTFGTVRSAFVKKSGLQRRFIMYCLYGWGVPVVWTTMTAICQFGSVLDDSYPSLKPDIHKVSCWFDDLGFSRVIFFVLPVSVIIICNTILFTMTVRYCSKVRSELNSIQNNDYAKKKFISDIKKMVMNMKLFIAMGINWALEIISLLVPPENRQFFFVSDVVNSLGGILIFLIFIMKQKTISDLKRKFCSKLCGVNDSNNAGRSAVSTSVFNSSVGSIINRDV